MAEEPSSTSDLVICEGPVGTEMEKGAENVGMETGENSSPTKIFAGTGDTLAERVLSQMHYYFGDNNYIRDKWIKDECAKNEDKWILIERLLTFNRLKALLQDIPESDHVRVIGEIMRASEIVDVDETGTMVRRNPDVPIDPNSEGRTVYLKGFPKDVTLDELFKAMEKFEGIVAIIMRKYKEKALETGPDGADKVAWLKKFKGSVFVVFGTVEQAKAFMESDVDYNGQKLHAKMMLLDYKQMKKDEYLARQEARKKKSTSPVKSGSPIKAGVKAGSPVKETGSPVKEAGTPANEAGSPIKAAENQDGEAKGEEESKENGEENANGNRKTGKARGGKRKGDGGRGRRKRRRRY